MTREPKRMLEPHPSAPAPGPAKSGHVQAWRSAPLCSALIVAALCVYVYDKFISGDGETARQALLLYGPWVQAGQYWRVVTYVFAHGGELHLLLNMSVVYTLGFALERAIGTWRMFVISLITAVGGAACALMFNFEVP